MELRAILSVRLEHLPSPVRDNAVAAALTALDRVALGLEASLKAAALDDVFAASVRSGSGTAPEYVRQLVPLVLQSTEDILATQMNWTALMSGMLNSVVGPLSTANVQSVCVRRRSAGARGRAVGDRQRPGYGRGRAGPVGVGRGSGGGGGRGTGGDGGGGSAMDLSLRGKSGFHFFLRGGGGGGGGGSIEPPKTGGRGRSGKGLN